VGEKQIKLYKLYEGRIKLRCGNYLKNYLVNHMGYKSYKNRYIQETGGITMRLRGVLILAQVAVLTLISTSWVFGQNYSSENLFYLTGSMQGYESFMKHADEISIVCPAAYQIDQYGVITGGVDRRVLETAEKKGVKVMPLFASFNQEGLHKLLNDMPARAEAIRLMLFYARKYHYYGWQFDLENMHMTDRDAYTSFYQQTADSLHKYGLKISIAVVKTDQPAPISGNPAYARFLYENWRGAVDMPAIAKASDFISFMTYDQHTALTPPGPVAGLPWMKKMLNYLLDIGISPEKISLGIPSYSDHWYPTWDKQQGAHSTRDEISYAKAKDLLDRYEAKEQWMDDQNVNYARWAEGGIFNWLFLENARSFAPKFDLAKEHHLLGISVWVLGTEDPAIWTVLKKQAKTVRIK